MSNHGQNNLCASCAYYVISAQIRQQNLNSNAGECHRHPPVTNIRQLANGTMTVATNFPVVNDVTWCGDHSDIEAERQVTHAKLIEAMKDGAP